MDKFSKDYDTLVLCGGGVNGYGLLGSLQYLKDHKRLDSINTYVGTSIGAIISYLLCIGCTPMDIVVYLTSKNVMKSLAQINVISMIQGGGSLDYNVLQNHIEKVTIDKIGQFLTLKGLRDKLGKTLIVCTYNLTKDTTEYIGPDNYPDMPCLVAVRMSSNVPLLFEDFKYLGDYYIDGGIVDNFPIDIPCISDKNKIGIVIEIKSKEYKKPSLDTNILDYIFHILLIPINKVQTNKIKSTIEKNEDLIVLIDLDDKKYNGFNFSLSSRDTLELFSIGYSNTKKIFE
jgi:predicted acylesterase/phospholipase RssA